MNGSLALGDVLKKTLTDLGLFPKAKRYQVFSLWAGIVGDIAKYARPRRLQGEVLYVATASSVWSQELHFMQESILAKINQALGGDEIREIRFSEHMWGSAETAPGSVSDPVTPPFGDDDVTCPADHSGQIADADLASALRKMAVAMANRRRHLLLKGYKLCATCGCVYPASKPECPECRISRESREIARAIAILDERPELDDRELAGLLRLSDTRSCERARVEVESRLLSFIRARLAAEVREAEGDPRPVRARTPERKRSQTELAAAVRKLASLRSCQPYEAMSAEDVEKAVGRKYAALAKKG